MYQASVNGAKAPWEGRQRDYQAQNCLPTRGERRRLRQQTIQNCLSGMYRYCVLKSCQLAFFKVDAVCAYLPFLPNPQATLPVGWTTTSAIARDRPCATCSSPAAVSLTVKAVRSRDSSNGRLTIPVVPVFRLRPVGVVYRTSQILSILSGSGWMLYQQDWVRREYSKHADPSALPLESSRFSRLGRKLTDVTLRSTFRCRRPTQ